MLAGSSYRATFETHLGNGLPADCPFKIHISLAAMCRNLWRTWKQPIFPCNYFYLEWLFPHQIEVYGWTPEPEPSSLSAPGTVRAASCALLAWQLSTALLSHSDGCWVCPLTRDLWGPGRGFPARIWSCSTSCAVFHGNFDAKAVWWSTLLGLDYEMKTDIDASKMCLFFFVLFFWLVFSTSSGIFLFLLGSLLWLNSHHGEGDKILWPMVIV